MYRILVLIFSFFACIVTGRPDCYAQLKMPDAALLAPAASINEILGTHIVEGPSSVKGTYCDRRASDGSDEAIIQYTDFHDSKTAEMMLKMNLEGNQKDIAENKLAVGIFETVTLFPDGGVNANVMTGTGANSAWKNNVRFQFVLGSYLVTFDTRNVTVASVTGKLSPIYQIIRKNSGM